MKTVVILGPTGSGKTGVGIEIAKRIGGEIISADSRAIYRGMDIGTAKPTEEEREGVIHHGFDLAEPGERFTVADWKAYALDKMEDIRRRGKAPMIVGGTGLYIDALIFDYQFKGPTGEKIGDFEQKSCSDRTEVKGDYLLVGIKWETSKLKERLRRRIEIMFNEPLFEETRNLSTKYGWDNVVMKSNIYKYVDKYLKGELTADEAKLRSFYDDYHLAKRQMTWFRRNPEIHWLKLDKIYSFVLKYIQDDKRN